MQPFPTIRLAVPTRLAAPFDSPEWVFEMKHDGFRRALATLNQLAEPKLTLNQWELSQVTVIQKQEIKRIERWLTTATEQGVKLTATFVIQDNLTVRHSILNPQPGQFSAERGKAFVDVVLPRHQIASAIGNVGECS